MAPQPPAVQQATSGRSNGRLEEVMQRLQELRENQQGGSSDANVHEESINMLQQLADNQAASDELLNDIYDNADHAGLSSAETANLLAAATQSANQTSAPVSEGQRPSLPASFREASLRRVSFLAPPGSRTATQPPAVSVSEADSASESHSRDRVKRKASKAKRSQKSKKVKRSRASSQPDSSSSSESDSSSSSESESDSDPDSSKPPAFKFKQNEVHSKFSKEVLKTIKALKKAKGSARRKLMKRLEARANDHLRDTFLLDVHGPKVFEMFKQMGKSHIAQKDTARLQMALALSNQSQLADLQHGRQPSAFGRGRPTAQPHQGRPGPRPVINKSNRCRTCGQLGHWAADCPNKFDKRPGNGGGAGAAAPM